MFVVWEGGVEVGEGEKALCGVHSRDEVGGGG